ncbi:histone deacetylase 14 [Tanacetum coccineum]
MPAYDRALCPVLAILSGSVLVPGIIPKRDLGIPICLGNVLGTSLPDALYVVHPGLSVYNPMRYLEGSLVGIVQLLQVLMDARIDICPTLGLHHDLPSTPIILQICNTTKLFSMSFNTSMAIPIDLQEMQSAQTASTLAYKIERTQQLKFRGFEIIQLQNYKTATFEDIADKHSRAYISPLKKTFKESLVSAGAGISLVDYVVISAQVLMQKWQNGPLEFCSVGNVATAAGYAQHVHGLQRVFIIDFSAHPGKGTNDVFNDDPDVFFLSTHQDGILPGAGKIDDIGYGNGVGATLNLPHLQFPTSYAQVITRLKRGNPPISSKRPFESVCGGSKLEGMGPDSRAECFTTLSSPSFRPSPITYTNGEAEKHSPPDIQPGKRVQEPHKSQDSKDSNETLTAFKENNRRD